MKLIFMYFQDILSSFALIVKKAKKFLEFIKKQQQNKT